MASSWGSHAVEAGVAYSDPMRTASRPLRLATLSPRTRDWSRLARRIWARWGGSRSLRSVAVERDVVSAQPERVPQAGQALRGVA